VIEKTYGHKTYYLTAANQKTSSEPTNSSNSINSVNPIVGILPLVHLKHLIFGNSLISMPFFDLGGILADGEEIERALLLHAIKLGQQLKATTIELRHAQPLSCLNSTNSINLTNPMNSTDPTNLSNPINSFPVATRSHKVRMLLNLLGSSDKLMKSFKAKLRSQIKKPMKEGLVTKIGGPELLDHFYRVFSINMRDLGSPVHSLKLIRNVLDEFAHDARIFVVYRENQSMACSLIIAFKEILQNPWASALREYSHLSPNMLLYWSMLEYACNNGLTKFDFGRSTPGEGTFKFKEQWGAKPTALQWHYISLNGRPINEERSGKSQFESLVRYWQKLPVSVSQVIGPMIRKHIGL